MKEAKEVRFKWSEAKSLVSVWFLAIAISFLSLITSCGVVVTRRVNWSCAEDGHHFTARYEIQNPDKATVASITSQFAEEHPSWKAQAYEKSKQHVYISDVCTYCGEVIQNGIQTQDTR